MGAKESKPSCISYEEAIKRVSESELRRIREAFKKSAGPGGSCISQSAFQQDVLCEGVPAIVADWLYVACGGTSKGITYKDLFCALVLLTRGKEDEKIRFLWNLYCNDSGTYILKSDYTKALNLESNLNSSEVNEARGIPNASLIHSLFGQSDRANFDQFRDWIVNHKSSTVLAKWLLSTDACIHLTSELETPTFYQSLAGVTHLEEQDIGDLEKEFWRLKSNSATGQLDLESLGPLISPPIPKAALAGLFFAFDENRDGHIDFKELCCGVSAACRGPNVERSKFSFKVFDIDRDGILNYDEITQMIDILIFVAKESSNSYNYRTLTKNHVINDLLRFSRKNDNQISENNSSVHHILNEEDDDFQNFRLTQEDFMMWSMQSALNLVQPFLDLSFEVCHIVFGLRPQCKHMEYDIVKGWLSREEKRGYRVGQFWYLISKEWWNGWQQYTQNNGSNCPYCKNSGNNAGSKGTTGVDEAMVCDESFTSNSSESMGDLLATADTSSLGSCSSGISCGRQLLRPGPIDNTNLITPNVFKSIRTLTGEGGHLKRDTPLAQHNDFELVPKSLWKALSRWYSDILPLPRQVIQPPNAPDVELELYPLNLRILLHQNLPPVNQTISTWGTISGGYGAITSGGYTTMSSVPNVLQPPKRYLAYTAAFSRLATVKQIGEFLCEQLKLKQEDIRLWHILNPGLSQSDDVPILLEEEYMTLKDLMIKDKDQILLEIRNKDLTWPEELGSLSLNQTSIHDRRPTSVSVQSLHALGATGLHNLGNTCFMNAALQVLFNTQPLTQYFKRNMHMFELNTVNKLGTKGQLATRYGELLKEVWTATTRSVAPLKLRFCVTKHAPQFAGGGQHDSQELLEWMLDALHEDLNRVTEKPYAELKDSDGRPDEVVASEAWAQHHARNQSIVIDLFYGQLKSKVSCLCCGRESVRFDPFSLLSLPLPVENFTYFEVLVILLDGSMPIKYGLRLNSDAKYSDLKKKLASLCHLNPNLFLVCELSNSQIKCIFNNDQKIKATNATELYAYQLPEGDECRSRTSSILGVNIEKGLKDIQRSPELPNRTQPMNLQPTKQIFEKAPVDVHQQTTFDEITENIPCGRRSSKVSRCFGNTMCMPQTLLCFKQSADISTSPENTFVNIHRKRISATNLLNDNTQSCNNSSDEASIERTSCNAVEEEEYNGSNHDDAEIIRSDCPCRSISDSCEDDDNNSIPFSKDCRRKSYFTRTSQNHRIGPYLIAVHRKLSRQDMYFLSYHKTRPSLFGVPLLIPCYENCTNKDLYCAVWMQVSRLLSPLPPAPDQSNHAADCDDSLGYDFPFTLRAVTSDGRICALCPWSNFCRGCEIPCNDDLLLQGRLIPSSAGSSNASTPKLSARFSSLPNLDSSKTPKPSKSSNVDFSSINIAIDWDPTALHLRYQSTREKIWIEHESVAICRRQQIEPVDLNHCLQAFTSEEKLEQWYHCSHCKGKKPATKKLQIWRLPPILIIHLKRFNCVNGKWVKSQKVVNFPFDDFDPTPYLASVPQETILRHKELLDTKKQHSKNMFNEDCKQEIEEFDKEVVRQSKINEESAEQEDDMCKDRAGDDVKNHLNTNDQNKQIGDNCSKNKPEQLKTVPRKLPNSTIERRRRLISTSLTKTPIIDGHFKDFHHHKLKAGVDNFDLKYKLYAVVSHSGMLNGGHYVSYASNPNGSWYCYNDSSCREIANRPNIDPSSAYLLFYERQGLDYEPYLPNVDGRSLSNGSAVEVDESEGDLRKLCVLS